MFVKKQLFVKSAIVLAGFSLHGIAAPDSTRDSTVHELQKMVVTGTKTERAITLTPVKTEVIGPEDIQRYGACNLYQVLDGTPGIRMEQQCNNCNFSIMRMNGLEGGYAKILIDGMPVYSGLAGVYGMQQIQAGLIERIEIVKGAGSALYGSDAVAGVVNIITRKPSPEPALEIGMSVGTNPFKDETRYAKTPLSTNVNFSASHMVGDFAAIVAAQTNSADEIDNNNDFATDRVWSRNLGGTTNLIWYDCMGKNSSISIMGRAIYEQRKGGSIEKDAYGNYPIDNALSPAGPGTEHITTERFEGGFSAEKEFVSGTGIRAIVNAVSHQRNATNGAAWEKLEGDSLVYTPFTMDDALSLAQKSPQPFLTREQTIVEELNASQKIGKSNTVLVGLQAKRTDVEENINGSGWFERYFQDIGVYLQDEWDIVEQFGFVAGLRYDHHQSEDNLAGSKYNENALNPRVSLKFKPVEYWTNRFSWGTGFRVPGDFSEDAHLCASALRIRKNNALKPERSMSFNLSSDIEKKMFSAGLSVFRANISDKVVLEEYSGSDDSYDLEWGNAEGGAYSQGLELRGGIESRLFEFEAAYVLTDARYEEEQIQGNEKSIHIPRSPMHTGNLDVSLFSDPAGERLRDAWRLNIGLNIVGSMYIERDGDVIDDYPEESLDEIVKTEPYATVDARLSKRISQIGLDVYVAAENLTNTVQDRKQWDVDDAAMVYAPLYGTTVNVGFTKSFLM